MAINFLFIYSFNSISIKTDFIPYFVTVTFLLGHIVFSFNIVIFVEAWELTLSYSGGSLTSLSASLTSSCIPGVMGSGRLWFCMPSGLWPGSKLSFSSLGNGAGGFFNMFVIIRGRVLGLFPSENETGSFKT